MKHKILYIGNFELPDKNASANRISVNCKMLRQCGYDVYCIGTNRTACFHGIRKSEFDNTVYERSYPTTMIDWIRQTASISDVTKFISDTSGISCVILYNTPFVFTKKMFWYCKHCRIKLIYECTEWNDYAEGNLIKRLYKKYDAYFIRNKIDRFCNGLIVTSKMMIRSYSAVNKFLLPSLVDTEDKIWHQDYRHLSDTFEFCYAGDPGNKDNLKLMIDAFSSLQRENVKLTIIGIDNGNANISSETEDYEMPNNVEFLGRLPHQDTVKRIQNADCFLMIREINRRNNAGFPLKFVESYTTGVSVITTNVSDVSDYDTDGIFIVKKNSKDEIVNAMQQVIDYNIKNAYRKILRREAFDYRKYTESFRGFLSSVN